MQRLLLILLSLSLCLIARDPDKGSKKNRQKTFVTNGEVHANNVKATVANNGWLFWGGGASGFVTPSPVFDNNPNDRATVFASGLWLVGEINGERRAAIANYSTDFVPGTIGSDPNSPDFDVYYYYSPSHLSYLNDLLAQPDQTQDQRIHQFAQAELSKANFYNPKWTSKAIPQGAPTVPPGDVAAYTIYHDTDSIQRANNGTNYSKTPLNVEVRMLVFSFKSDIRPINNAVFVKMEFINKNNVPIDNMFASVWSDADLGDPNDDLVGSDPKIELGYAYNGSDFDSQYTGDLGIAPPAVGYDYFEGPIVDSVGHNIAARNSQNSDLTIYVNVDEDYIAKPNDIIIQDKYVRPATGFFYYNNGQDPRDADQYYYTAQSLGSNGQPNSFQTNALNSGLTTEENKNWFFNGDPANGTGWLDNGPNDRRFVLNNGPFQLGVSNGSESFGDPGYNSVVFGVFTSFASSNLSSVEALKFDDSAIQQAFNRAFDEPQMIPAPYGNISFLNNAFLLNWQSSNDGNQTTENFSFDGYNFEGYEIVLFDNENSESYQSIQIFDKINGIRNIKNTYLDEDGDLVSKTVIRGTDNGSRNSGEFNVPNDRDIYAFGIRAYAVNPNSETGTNAIFSEFFRFNPINNIEDDEINITVGYGETINYTNTGDASNGYPFVVVTDPYSTTNANYTVNFTTLNQTTYYPGYGNNDSIPAGTLVWNLYKNASLISSNNPQNFNVENGNINYAVYDDGLRIIISSPPNDFKSFIVTSNANGDLNPPEIGAFAFNGNGFPFLNGADQPDPARQQSNGSMWGIATNGDGFSYATYDSFKARVVRNGWLDIVPYDFEIRFNDDSDNYGWDGYGFGPTETYNIPFELWNTTLNVRMIPITIDEDADGFGIRKSDHEVSGGANDPQTDRFYWYMPIDQTPGESGYQAAFANGLSSTGGEIFSQIVNREVFGNMVFVNWNGGDVNADSTTFYTNTILMPESGTVFRIETNKTNTNSSEFTFSGPGEPQAYVKHQLTGSVKYNGSNLKAKSYNPYVFLRSNFRIRYFGDVREDGIYEFDLREGEDYRIIMADLDRSYNIDQNQDGQIDRDDYDQRRRSNGITSLDLVLMQRHILMKDTLPTALNRLSADVNQDSMITASDLSTVQQFILGNVNTFYSHWNKQINDTTIINVLDSTIWFVFPENYVFQNADLPTNEWRYNFNRVINITEPTEFNYIGGRFGDVNSSWVPNEEENRRRSKSTPLELRMDYSKLDANRFNVPVSLSPYQGLNGFSFTVKWNPEELEFDGAEFASEFGLTEKNINTKYAEKGMISVLWFDGSGESIDIDEVKSLFNMNFKQISDEVSTIEITSDIAERAASNDKLEEIDILAPSLDLNGNNIELPTSFDLEQNYPNPFNPVTNIRFSVPSKSLVSLKIYNTLGKLVYTHEETYDAGVQVFTWSGRNQQGNKVASGVYYYRMQAGKFSQVKKMILIK